MTKILVVIDPKEKVNSALERCREVSPDTENLQLHVCMFVEVADAKVMASRLKKRMLWLDEQTKPFLELGYKLTAEVKSFSRLYEAVIQSALEAKADLIFKPMRQHSIIRRAVLTSTDWNLIRFCPLPILLVNEGENLRGKDILAAVDVANSDPSHEELNGIVMTESLRVAGALDSQVSCVNAWSVGSAVMAAGTVDPTPYEIVHDKRVDHIKSAITLAEQYGIPEERVIVEQGAPEFVINAAARDIDAGVVVIGTVARSGVSGLFVGNTAEAVLEESSVDVMVVKQAGFECPLDL